MYHCERSIRQRWSLNKDGQIELYNIAIDTEATDGYLARLCLGEGVSGWQVLVLACLEMRHVCGGPLTSRHTNRLTPTPTGRYWPAWKRHP